MSFKLFADPKNKALTLASWKLSQGARTGTASVPFRVVDREEYLSKVRGRGLAARVDAAPVEEVPLDSLHAIQKSVNTERLTQHFNGEAAIKPGQRAPGHGMLTDIPVVVRTGGQSYIHDGHHRATVAFLNGSKNLRARVVDLDSSDE